MRTDTAVIGPVLALLFAAALVSSACGTGGSNVEVNPGRSTVGIEASGCSLVSMWGTGFVVADATTVVTAAHTVAGATDVIVHDTDGNEHVAEIRRFDSERDLAVLYVATLDRQSLRIARAEMDVSATLFRWDLQAEPKTLATTPVRTVKRLDVTIEDIYREREVQRDAFEVSGEVVTGDSGGPVVSASGEVWGVVYAASRTRDRTGFALDDHELNAVLAEASTAAVSSGRCL